MNILIILPKNVILFKDTEAWNFLEFTPGSITLIITIMCNFQNVSLNYRDVTIPVPFYFIPNWMEITNKGHIIVFSYLYEYVKCHVLYKIHCWTPMGLFYLFLGVYIKHCYSVNTISHNKAYYLNNSMKDEWELE